MTTQPIQVLFVCMGNICRSPMAEAVFRHMVANAGLADRFVIDSAGTDSWHAGEPPHHGTQRTLNQHGVAVGDQHARRLTADDLQQFDYVLAMDAENLDAMGQMRHQTGKDIRRLLEFVPNSSTLDVPDPYYEGGFDYVYDLVTAGCTGLLQHIRQQEDL